MYRLALVASLSVCLWVSLLATSCSRLIKTLRRPRIWSLSLKQSSQMAYIPDSSEEFTDEYDDDYDTYVLTLDDMEALKFLLGDSFVRNVVSTFLDACYELPDALPAAATRDL